MISKISPSMMCADIFEIKSTLNTFEKENIEYLHIDVMDGVFVPNLMLSNGITKQYRAITNIPFDYHLMIVDPLEKLDWFDIKENDLVSFHIESTEKINETIDGIRGKKAKAGLAIKPSTPVSAIIPYIGRIDFILVMTVNPGFAGQQLISSTLDKIKEVRELLDNKGFNQVMIEVDGNVSFENAVIMKEKGADIFVAGTSSVFRKNVMMEDAIKQLREAIK